MDVMKENLSFGAVWFSIKTVQSFSLRILWLGAQNLFIDDDKFRKTIRGSFEYAVAVEWEEERISEIS